MAKLQLSMSVGIYDRTFSIFDGRTPIEGCGVNAVPLLPEEAFHRAFKHQEFDVTEMSLSSHALTVSRGESKYVGIPAFVSRVFRHSGIYIRTDRGIRAPEDLRGKTIGLPEYQLTAVVWIRGILQDEYGVRPSEIKWRTGGIEEPGRGERSPLKLPPEIDVQPIPRDRTLCEMLASGELDALFSARAPSVFLRGTSKVDRLFPDYVPVEEAYFRRTRIFPIMHLIGIRRSLAERHPWLAVSVLKAFAKAKAIALEDLSLIGHLAATLPWPVAEYQRAKKLMGDDYWSYDIEANRHTLETFLRYSHEQGLIKPIPVEALFAPSVIELSRI
ncbi:MAG: ABC transporter substrate-binding protein [Betaproteobacteria bacterium]|nr:ABC transporter substrate-binding protein [Betaproteobacteria bacterium]